MRGSSHHSRDLEIRNSNRGFSDEALKGAFLYVVGVHLKLVSGRVSSRAQLAENLIDNVKNVLGRAGVSQAKISSVLRTMEAAQNAIDTEPVSLRVSEYESCRLEATRLLGFTSAKGVRTWPPTSQTFLKRFGGWNDTLHAFGLVATNKGRAKGSLKFTDVDYLDAVRDYCTFCDDSGVVHSFSRYGKWVQTEADLGRKRPSPASVRAHFGTWSNALNNALGVEGRAES